jgi:hypothetical protein
MFDRQISGVFRLCLCVAAWMFLPAAVPAAEPAPVIVSRLVAIDNVCAWPNLTVLGDGTITATIFGQPSHGKVAGSVECWASGDGQFWERRGAPAPNDPSTNRMNVAAGLARNGDLLVLCSGWTDVQQPGRLKQAPFRDATLRIWVCRSSDGGRTWTQYKDFLAPKEGESEYIPFGDIFVGEDGALHTSCYHGGFIDPTMKTGKAKRLVALHFRSDDDGRTWRPTSVIAEGHNETTLLHLDARRWLAASRSDAVDLFRSDDDGQTWQGPVRVTEPKELNGHLQRLKDGRLLLSYGSRVKGCYGVRVRLSSDEGVTWGEPFALIADLLSGDCGYPSSVQRPDGSIVTAFYASAAPDHQRYHMGVLIWNPPAMPKP